MKRTKFYGQNIPAVTAEEILLRFGSRTRLRDSLEMTCYDLQISWRRSTPYISIELGGAISARHFAIGFRRRTTPLYDRRLDDAPTLRELVNCA